MIAKPRRNTHQCESETLTYSLAMLWIRILIQIRIRIRIGSGFNWVPGCSLLRAEGFSCSLDVL
jgi:hypothetical protein